MASGEKKEPVKIGNLICVEEEEAVLQLEEKPQELRTCPADPRFQQQNKTSWCYTMFIDFHRCVYLLGTGAPQCKYFERCYKTLCPNEWIRNWDEQIGKGNFPRDLTKEMGR